DTIVETANEKLPLLMLLNLAAFFVTAMVCHGELARRRPAAGHLTAFYMWMSAGGGIGGIATAFVAPYLLSLGAEEPRLVVLAILGRPRLSFADPKRPALIVGGFVVAAAIIVVPATFFGYALDDQQFYWSLRVLLFVALAASLWSNPLPFAALIVLTFMVWRFFPGAPPPPRRFSCAVTI